MNVGAMIRRSWREALLIVAVVLPWLSLFVLGGIWLWQHGYIWIWAAAAAAFGLIAWPLARSVRQRADDDARQALGDLAKPSGGWNQRESEAWTEVIAIADATAPFSFFELDPLLAQARQTIEAVARKFNPEVHTAWSQFSLPEALLLAERLCRDVRREALRHIPGMRSIRLSHLLWMQRQSEQYGEVAMTGWRITYGLWRLFRAVVNPLQAATQEASSLFAQNAGKVLSYRLRTYATRMFVLEVGRAAIDLYSGRLALSEDEVRAARQQDLASTEPAADAPVRILLVGQVSAGKSSLLNALAVAVRAAVGPLPTTTSVSEHQLELDGRPAVILADMPGLEGSATTPKDLLLQAARADLILWVASAIQPAREPDRQALQAVRAWANAQLTRRPAPILVALTHIDQLRPAAEWKPPYNIATPTDAKARAIRAAMDAVAQVLELTASNVVPVAMPPDREPYNIDALWGQIANVIDQAKLVQLDRLRIAHQRSSLREIANQLGNAGRIVIKGIASS